MEEIAVTRVLKVPSFRSLWLAQFISQVFLNLLFFSLMIQVYDLTKSNSAVSVIVLLVAIPNILFGALAGVLVDRSERKTVMFFSHFLRVFVVLAFLVSAETLSWVYLLVFLISIITQFFSPAEAASIHELITDPKKLLTANSLYSLTFFGSVILGNVLAGPFLSAFGARGTFLIVAVAFLVASIFTAQLPGESIWDWLKGHLAGRSLRPYWFDINVLRQGTIFSEFLEGLDHLYKTPIVRRGIFVLGSSQVTIGVLGSIAPGFADKILRISTDDVSVFMMAPAAVGMVVGAMSIGQFFRNFRREDLVKSGFILVSVVLIIYSFVDYISRAAGLPIIVPSFMLLLVLGAANAFLDVPVNTLIQEHTPERVRSRVYGVVSMVVGIASIVPVILAGALADMFGVRLVMLAVGLCFLGLTVYNYLIKHRGLL